MPDSLEQLDLLLIQVAKARQVRADGIHFQSLRYISTTLAAYVGETVTLRIDPRDMAEVRVFHEGKFLCRAVCAELAGETVPLREILRARNRRRRELRGVLRDRQAAVDTLLDLKRGEKSRLELFVLRTGSGHRYVQSHHAVRMSGETSGFSSAKVVFFRENFLLTLRSPSGGGYIPLEALLTK